MLVSFQMLPEQPASELLEAVVLADRLGYHGCYSADEIYHKDAWLLFAALAQRTERIRLGPAMGGPKSMELAGEIADGLHTACAYSSQALDYAVEHFRAGVERADRSPEGLDLGDSLLGAIAPDGEVARRAGRVMAAFYIPSMPPALLQRHGIEPEQVAPVNEAFAIGDVQRALEATPEEIADRIMVAGTPEDWVSWLRDTHVPAGLNHALVSFADPFTLKTWAGIEVQGLPELGEQVRLVGEQVLPELAAL